MKILVVNQKILSVKLLAPKFLDTVDGININPTPFGLGSSDGESEEELE